MCPSQGQEIFLAIDRVVFIEHRLREQVYGCTCDRRVCGI